MPLLTHQRTFQSVHSWWSNSNPPRATINLHAVSKPLMKFFYHRRALSFMKKNRHIPLSGEILQIYYSYLTFKYVSSSTKTMILRELYHRGWENLPTLLDAFDFNQLLQFCESPDREIRLSIVRMVTSPILRTPAACLQLVSLLQDKDFGVVEAAIRALDWFVDSPNFAQAAVDAKVVERFSELLESPHPSIRQRTCWTLGKLADHNLTEAAISGSNCCVQLASLVRDDDADIVNKALLALNNIAYWPSGAQAVVEAKTLNHLMELRESPDYLVQLRTCQILKNLTSHESTTPVVLGMGFCVRLVELLQYPEYYGIHAHAIHALANISRYAPGVAAVGQTAVLQHISDLISTKDRKVQFSICVILRNLARYKPRRPVVISPLKNYFSGIWTERPPV